MPTYDYECASCEAHHEIFQKMSDAPLKTCPACGKDTLKRLIGTGGAVIFKGGGFYQTDYRSKSYQEGEKKDKPAAATPAASDSAKPSTSEKKDTPKKDSAPSTGGSP